MCMSFIDWFITELRTDDRRIPPRPSPLDVRGFGSPHDLPLVDRRLSQLTELEHLRRSTQTSADLSTCVPQALRPDPSVFRHIQGMFD